MHAIVLAVALLLADQNDDVIAATRTATTLAHTAGEIANACAQRKPECPTATPTPLPTRTPVSTSTPRPADTPVPALTSTPQPCWATDDDGAVLFDDLGAPVPCPLEIAQVLPPGGPADDGLAVEPDALPPVLEPPPADPDHPDQPAPTPLVIVIVATAAPVPTLPPQVVYVQQPQAVLPTPPPAQVIYLVVTPTPTPTEASTPAGATLPTLEPTAAPTSATVAEPAASEPATVVDEAVPSAEQLDQVDDAPQAPVDDDESAHGEPPAPTRAPAPPMLASFGLWAGARRRVQEDTHPWLPLLA